MFNQEVANPAESGNPGIFVVYNVSQGPLKPAFL